MSNKHWIGHPGSLLPIRDRGEESSQADQRVALSTSLGGTTRARVSRKRAPRSWSLNVPNAHWDEVAHVEALLAATLGPYRLVTARMQVSNVLTPERSVMTDQALGMGGVWPIEGGEWATTVRLNPSAAFGNEAPVWVGPAPTPPVFTARPVTVSAYLATARVEGARVWLEWLDAAGVVISGSFVAGNLVSGMDVLRRSTATGVPPAGAVACRVAVSYAEVISMPQVTWTDGPIEWTPGKGVDQVVVTNFGDSTSIAAPDSRNFRRTSVGIDLQEVGP